MGTLEKKMANATKWSSMAEMASKLVSPIVNMILARVLTPSAFGVVATINIIITFAEIFQDAGFQKYLIQHKFLSEDEFEQSANVAFWTNFGFSFIIWILICVFKQPLSYLVNNTNDLGLEIAIASVSLPVFAFSSIQIAICKRKFNFRKLFWVRLITSVIPLLITVPLALAFRNHWALIIGTIFRNVVQSVVLFKGGWVPKMKYSVLRLRKMLSFCVWTLAESVTIWLTANMSTFVVTRTLGVDAVGFFKTSISTVTSIIGIISAATVPVLFTSLSRVQDDDERFEKIFTDYQKIVGLLVIPLGTGMLLYRDLLTDILLGSQWTMCMDFVGMYAFVCSLAIITNSFFSEYYRAKGNPRISMIAQLIYLSILTPATYFSSMVGFTSLCIVTCIMVLVFTLVHFIILKLVFRANIVKMLKNISLILIPTSIMAIFAMVSHKVIQSVLWEIVSVGICIFIYFTVALAIKPIRVWVSDNELTFGFYSKLRKVGSKWKK